MPRKKKETSPEIATKASKVLKDPKASKEAKSIAASALAQAPDEAVVEVAVEAPEVVEAPVAEVPKGWTPAIGEKFSLKGEIAVIDAQGLVTIHELRGGCQTERVIGTVDISNAEYLAPDEAFRRLAG